MAGRFAEIRQKAGKTQAEFAKMLEIGRSTVTNLEKGTTPLTDRNIKMVCFAFNVSDTWLRTGIGDMYTNTPEGPHTDDEKKLVSLFRQLIPELQGIVLQKVRDMVDTLKESWVPPGEKTEKRAAGD